MKTKYILAVLATALFFSISAQAQREVVFTEHFGENVDYKNETKGPYPLITSYSELYNSAVTLSDGGCAIVPDVRFTVVSAAHTVAAPELAYKEVSGGCNVFFDITPVGSERGFAMNNIVIPSFYKDLQLSFGYRKATNGVNSSLDIYSWNGSEWVKVDLEIEDADKAPGWYRINNIPLPADVNLSSFGLKFARKGDVAESETLRLDDVWLSGVPTIGDAPTVNEPSNVTVNGFTASWEAYEGASGYIIEVSEKATFESPEEADILAAWTFPVKYVTGDVPNANIYSANNEGKRISWTSTGNATNPIPYGSNAPFSITSTGWESGVYKKYWQIEVDATGFTDITLSSRNYASGNGPRFLAVQYRFDEEGEWISVPNGDITLPATTHVNLNDLQLPSACNNQPQLFIRWVVSGSVRSNVGAADYYVTSGGTSWIGDIYVNGKKSDLISEFPKTVTGTSHQVTGLDGGKTYYYRVKATDGTNISNVSVVKSAELTSGLSSLYNTNNVSVKYSKSNDKFDVKVPESVNNFSVQIVDLNGRSLIQTNVVGNSAQINGSNLPAGVYLISVNIDGNFVNFKSVK